MDMTIEIDLGQAARELNLPVESVQKTVMLLDEGNTVPFITRYRKDQTGALDEEQIRRVQEKVGKLRALAERKRTILRSLQSQELLSADLADQIRTASSLKRLEDLYLPYKPKKQTLATTARQRGLEPLAQDVFQGDPSASDLQARAQAFVNPDQGLATVDDVLLGVQHILAEVFSERADVRGRLRKIMQRSGQVVCSRIEPTKAEEAEASPPQSPTTTPELAHAGTPAEHAEPEHAEPEQGVPSESSLPQMGAAPEQVGAEAVPESVSEPAAEQISTVDIAGGLGEEEEALRAEPGAEAAAATEAVAGDTTPEETLTSEVISSEPPVAVTSEDERRDAVSDGSVDAAPVPGEQAGTEVTASVEMPREDVEGGDSPPEVPSEALGGQASERPSPVASTVAKAPVSAAPSKMTASARKRAKRGPLSVAITKKEKKRQRLEAAFKDYYEFQESVSRVPPHRVLAINRGERARIIRVKLEADLEAMAAEAETLLVTPEHPHRDFLRGCVRDALQRLLFPSLERELRREMTEKAEEHAVEVFARNLRKLLLQPPVRQRRVLAIDPGFRSGCKLIALDEFGNVLGHEIIHVIGKEEWISKGRSKMAELIRRHQLSVVAIGNGAGCRETEKLVVDLLHKELQGEDVAFVIVNEAGASVYSTSPLGREELPTFDAVLRSAISIGRRLLDPLSELVKINPANIGVGMYQHDVKAKHLRKSLDAVVESCVNYVGVDANTASPALLRYVSGMNQLTARRLCEYRAKHGPFRDREQLKQVPGFGEATFVQAAGFLKIADGDNPLDATWIHPESYELARRVLDQAGGCADDLRVGKPARPARPEKKSGFDQLLAEVSAPTATEAWSDSDVSESVDTSDAVVNATGPLAASVALPLPVSTDLETPALEQAPPDIQEEQPQDVSEPTEVEADASPGEAAVPLPEPAAAVSAPISEEAPVGEQVQGTEPAPQSADELVSEPSVVEVAVSGLAEPAETPVEAETDGASSGRRLQQLSRKLQELDAQALATQWAVSEVLVDDLLHSLARPGRDPREDFPPPVFRRGIVKLEDLEPGMQLSGTVLNVVDFGAFVDIGLPDSGLIHISRLADRFVRDPHEVVGVGDVLTVWVVEVDKQRRRVSLTAIKPGTEKPVETRQRPEKPRPRRPAGKRTPPPTQEKREGRGRGRGRAPREVQASSRPPRKPKPITPITKEMEEGKEPLRSFSDLMQFYQKKQTGENES